MLYEPHLNDLLSLIEEADAITQATGTAPLPEGSPQRNREAQTVVSVGP